jgi:hypothetical protein
MLGLVCAYCAHKLVEGAAHCLHCGAPAHAAEAGHEQPPAKPPAEQKQTESPKSSAPESESEESEDESENSWLSWLAIGLIAVVVVVAVVVVGRHIMAGPPPATDPVAALPDQLRSAATCTAQEPARSECVVVAADPLLREGLTGGRDLAFTATLVRREQLAAIVAQWRRQGGRIIVAGTVFVDVSPAAGVRYANSATGLRIETVTFTSEMSARTFVMRAGLARQPL